jgi:fructose-1,6-bisphosphatase/inositol monophosphatase family enzyme
MQLKATELARAFSVAKDLAVIAGKIIKDNLKIGTDREWKSDHTPVTMVDKQINQLVIDTIHREFPDHSILAEEGSDMGRSKQYVWVCDPIDGTFPFMHGIPVSTFTLALLEDGQPILGIIYDPIMDRLFSCVHGEKTKLNGQEVKTSVAKNISNTTVGVVFWKGNMDIFTPLLAKLVDAGGKIVDFCSIAYMDALVACGEFSAVVYPGLSAHDSAAAKIIIEGAGGVFTSLTGEIDRYDQSVHGHLACANQSIHDQIKSLLG